jgi:hypothetical protein
MHAGMLNIILSLFGRKFPVLNNEHKRKTARWFPPSVQLESHPPWLNTKIFGYYFISFWPLAELNTTSYGGYFIMIH